MLEKGSGEAIVLVKVSGKVIDDKHAMDNFAGWVAEVVAGGQRLIIVHGGGRQIDALGAQQGIEPNYVDGRRVTDDRTLEIVKMSLGGTVNLSLVSALVGRGVCAAGLSGSSARLVLAERRPPQVMVDSGGRRREVDFGLVGDIEAVNGSLLHGLLRLGVVPVIASLGVTAEGQILNINADSVAEAIAVELRCSRVVMVGDTDGIYRDVSDPESRIARIAAADLDRLAAHGAVSGGMLPKIAACRRMCEGGVSEVWLCRSAHVGGTVVHP